MNNQAIKKIQREVSEGEWERYFLQQLQYW